MAGPVTLLSSLGGAGSAQELGAQAVTPDMAPGNVLSLVRAYRDACLDEGATLEPVAEPMARTA